MIFSKLSESRYSWCLSTESPDVIPLVRNHTGFFQQMKALFLITNPEPQQAISITAKEENDFNIK